MNEENANTMQETQETVADAGLEQALAGAFDESGEAGEAPGTAETGEDTTPPAPPEDGGRAAPAQPAAPEGGQPGYTIKYEGREIALTLPELLTAAQKGMHYDVVRAERDALRQSPEAALIGELAAEAGMTREAYLSYVRSWKQDQAVQEQVAKGVPEAAARELLALREEKRGQTEQRTQERIEAARRAQFVALAREYPGLAELPAEVVEAIRSGEEPLSAYRAWDNRQLRQQVAALEQNRRNRGASAPSARSEAPAPTADPFDVGWDSVFSV